MKGLARRLGVLGSTAALAGLVTASAVFAAGPYQLKAVKDLGVPSGQTEANWMKASGTVEGNGRNVTIKASGLVPNGVYTAWWMDPPMSVGPLLDPPKNELKVDAQGNGSLSGTARSPLENHAMVVIAYHSDGKTHGEVPGEMGVNLFNHLVAETKSASAAGSLPKTGEPVTPVPLVIGAGSLLLAFGLIARRHRLVRGR